MYTNFFALKEIPFSIAPNPEYLFMSDRHREALAHLTYGLGSAGSKDSGVGGNGGFVLLTGEVGTGKTTISRCLMAQLPENTQAAFILNPTLSSQELLATICDEFKVRYRKTGATLKTLTDKIQEKLLKNHELNINTLLIIDEAQHLQPEVLEQLRLLTNLETDTKKLLQVILIGQPELQQLLQRRDLRQLAQRITARYHLLPLSLFEVEHYIKHRLSVADCHRTLFNKSAVKAIHKISQGIPRLINLLCHKALMLAYNQNDALVNKKIVMRAAVEALGDEYAKKPAKPYNALIVTLAASFIFAVTINVGVVNHWWGNEQVASNKSIASSVAPSEQKIRQLLLQESDQQGSQQQDSQQQDTKLQMSQQQQVIALQAQLEKLQQQQLALQAKQVAQAQQFNHSVVETMPKAEKNDPQLVVSSQPEVKRKAFAPSKIAPSQTPPSQTLQALTFDVDAVDGVSDDLLARFQSAIAEENATGASQVPSHLLANTQAQSVNRQRAEDSNLATTDLSQVSSISKMPAWVQQGVPTLAFEQHIYASDGQGWVRVNGKDRRAGESITIDLTLVDILPQKVILNYRGAVFSLPALTNW